MNRLATFIGDGILLMLLALSIPFAILVLGTPLALVIRFVLEILRTIF